MLWRMLETQAEWQARLAREDAFWNRPNDQVLSDLSRDKRSRVGWTANQAISKT